MDAVALNAGASLFVASEVASIAEGVGRAKELMASKAPHDVLRAVVEVTHA